jgi:hypothetical protein
MKFPANIFKFFIILFDVITQNFKISLEDVASLRKSSRHYPNYFQCLKIKKGKHVSLVFLKKNEGRIFPCMLSVYTSSSGFCIVTCSGVVYEHRTYIKYM